MKLCLVLLLIVAIAAPCAFAFLESSNESAFACTSPEYAFFGGDSTAAMADDSRRLLFQYGYTGKFARKKFLSYYALKKNNIPCGRRGTSYYNCRKRRQVNPYRRACTAITGCARFTD